LTVFTAEKGIKRRKFNIIIAILDQLLLIVVSFQWFSRFNGYTLIHADKQERNFFGGIDIKNET
jgi:hypothetical protein